MLPRKQWRRKFYGLYAGTKLKEQAERPIDKKLGEQAKRARGSQQRVCSENRGSDGS
jgi:hypothetical protein